MYVDAVCVVDGCCCFSAVYADGVCLLLKFAVVVAPSFSLLGDKY